MGVELEEPADAAAVRAPRTSVRGGLTALGLFTVLSVGLSVLGLDTGDGPLGPPPSYGIGISRDVGAEVTEGATVLSNDSWFAAHLEEVRPVSAGSESAGLELVAVEVAPASPSGIGMVDGAGYDVVDRGVRSRPAGYTVLPERRFGQDAGYIELLVRTKVLKPGTWHYRGYEVVYRSGFVRHRMVVDADFWACTPAGTTCPPETE